MLSTAFVLLGTPVTWLEVIAFALALGCVACNIREVHWGWPMAIASSLLYGWLFSENRLYGEAALQGLFAALSAWGWRQWLHGARGGPAAPGALRIATLGRRGAVLALSAWAAGAVALGFTLQRWTDSDAPFLDAFTTAGSVLGQCLLARKVLENWWVWIVVNAASVLLFAWKGLWLTVVLYALLGAMAVLGLHGWRARLALVRGAEA